MTNRKSDTRKLREIACGDLDGPERLAHCECGKLRSVDRPCGYRAPAAGRREDLTPH
jgi:hypothetical protein